MKHVCHAIGCGAEVPREKFMCAQHWYMVPRNIRRLITKNYRRGQCDDKRPSREWLSAARLAQEITRPRTM